MFSWTNCVTSAPPPWPGGFQAVNPRSWFASCEIRAEVVSRDLHDGRARGHTGIEEIDTLALIARGATGVKPAAGPRRASATQRDEGAILFLRISVFGG